jgi:hypothetical protein
MVRLVSCVMLALSVAACTTTPVPIVDHTGIDEATYNRDLAWCQNHIPFIGLGNPVATCLREKHYTVLYNG